MTSSFMRVITAVGLSVLPAAGASPQGDPGRCLVSHSLTTNNDCVDTGPGGGGSILIYIQSSANASCTTGHPVDCDLSQAYCNLNGHVSIYENGVLLGKQYLNVTMNCDQSFDIDIACPYGAIPAATVTVGCGICQ